MCFSMFSLPTTVTVSGIEYPVRTDYRVILESLPDSVFARVLRTRESFIPARSSRSMRSSGTAKMLIWFI